MNSQSIWKEAIVAYFKVLPRNLSGGIEKNTNILVQAVTGSGFELGTFGKESRSVTDCTGVPGNIH
jgi:hypothetical protein